MKVAHVGNYRPDEADGVKSFIANVASRLPLQGVRAELWHVDHRITEVGSRTVDGIEVWELPGQASMPMALTLPAVTAAFVRQRSREVDLVHLHSAFAPTNLAVSRMVPRYVLTPHNGYHPRVLSGRNRVAKWLWLRAFELRHVSGARAIQVVGPSEEQDVRRLAPTARIQTVPTGFDSGLLSEATVPPSEGAQWLFLGRLDAVSKGLDILIHAYARAAEVVEVPDLALVGPDFRGHRVRLGRLAESLGVADRVSMPGPAFGPDKLRLLGAARAVVQPSRWEGMSLALLEALALGRPALVTPGTNMATSVAEARAGIAVDGTASALADGLIALARASGAELDAMGQRARRFAAANHTWDQVVRRMCQAYAVALEGG